MNKDVLFRENPSFVDQISENNTTAQVCEDYIPPL